MSYPSHMGIQMGHIGNNVEDDFIRIAGLDYTAEEVDPLRALWLDVNDPDAAPAERDAAREAF